MNLSSARTAVAFHVMKVTALVAIFATARVQAQSFDTLAPKQPVKTAQGKVVNNAAPKVMTGHSDNEVLVAHLKGVFFLSNPGQVRADGVSSPHSIVAGDVAFANRADFQTVVQPYLGQPVTMTSLAQLTRSIVTYYRDHDRPVVNVYVPQQSITSGYVQIIVLETRVGKVDATGAHWFSNAYLRSEMTLRPGESISGSGIRNDVAWVNRNPFLQSDVLLAPGDEPGTTDVLLHTQDRFPLRVYVGYEDSGNQYTGDDRVLTGFNYGNLFGVGQQLSYQFTRGSDVNKFYAHSGTYIIPLPWHHQLTFFGSYDATNSEAIPGDYVSGVNWQVSGRYEIPLPGTEHFSQSLTAGFDFKRNNNGFVFNIASPNDSNTDVDQLVFGYQANATDDYGSTSFSATGFVSPGGGLTSYNNDSDYNLQREGAHTNYFYGQVTLDRVTRLPFDFSWTVRGELQESDANLLPSEQLGLGGYETVRGYDEREANGDNGFLASTEIATPPISLFGLLGCTKVKDQLQFLGFVDYGGTSLHHTTAADVNPNSNLLGIGPGLRYAINPYVSLRFDYGFQMISTGLDNRHDSRAHLGVVVSY